MPQQLACVVGAICAGTNLVLRVEYSTVMISNPDGCAIIKIATQILTDLIIKIYMQNPRAILSNAIRGSLDDLQANYQYLAAMHPADRDKVLVDANVELRVGP